MEPQSLPDTARAQVRQADRRLGMKPESIAEAADRLREEARIAMVGEKARLTGGDPLIASPAPESAPSPPRRPDIMCEVFIPRPTDLLVDEIPDSP